MPRASKSNADQKLEPFPGPFRLQPLQLRSTGPSRNFDIFICPFDTSAASVNKVLLPCPSRHVPCNPRDPQLLPRFSYRPLSFSSIILRRPTAKTTATRGSLILDYRDTDTFKYNTSLIGSRRCSVRSVYLLGGKC